MTGNCAKVVEAFLRAFAAGDIQTALSYLCEDTVFDEARGMPFSGTYIGAGGFKSLARAISTDLAASVRGFTVLDAGTAAIAQIDMTFTSRATGRRLETSTVEIYRVKDGKITQGDVYYKDPLAVKDLISG